MPCPCGFENTAPLNRSQIDARMRLRGHEINICPLCRHEVDPVVTVADVRKLGCWGTKIAHKACVEARKRR